jgi:hypothetical protein
MGKKRNQGNTSPSIIPKRNKLTHIGKEEEKKKSRKTIK